MAEFKLGRIRFIWKGAWGGSTEYLKDDIVRYGGRTYVCVSGHTSTSNFYDDETNWNKFSDGTEWKNDWTTGVFYKENDIVAYGGILYICNDGHLAGSILEDDQEKWDLFATSIEWKSDWVAGTQYKANDLVKYGGNIYFCNTGHTAAATDALGLEANQNSWDTFSEGLDWKANWDTEVRYKVNDIVKYGGTTYVCNQGHTSAATAGLGLEDDQEKWDYLNQGFDYKGDWANVTRYKVNDIVKYGATLWICTASHTSVAVSDDSGTGTLSADQDNWEIFVPGLEFENTWDYNTNYQPGDFVTFGGYSYVAAENNFNKQPGTGSEWELLTTGFRLMGDWAEDSATQEYRVGDIVRLGGYTYLCVTNHEGAENRPPDPTYWERLNQGIEWKDEWTDATFYDAGDAVRYGLISYICILAHTSETANRPDNDSLGTYWNNLASGAEESALTTEGDILYYGGSGPARLPIGSEGQVLSVAPEGIPEWIDFGATEDVYYVAQNGVDSPAPDYGITLDRPWATIRYAAEQVEKGPKNPNAAYLLEVNRTYIQKEVGEWTKRQIVTETDPFFIGFDFDQLQFERLIGFVLDGIALDIRKNGNKETLRVAQTFIDQTDGDWFNVGGEEQNVASLAYMLTLIENVINSEDPAVNYQTEGSIAPENQYIQVKDATRPAEDGVYAIITELEGIVANAVELGGGYTLPDLKKIHTSIFVKTGTFTEVLPIRVPAYCAIVGDELRSTRVQPAGEIVDSGDVSYSLAGITHLKDVIGDIVQGNEITPTTGNTIDQDISLPHSDSDTAAILENFCDQLYDKIDYEINGASGDSSAPAFGGTTERVDDLQIQRAVRLLELNKDFLAREVTAKINDDYPAYSYDETACERDIRAYIDAFKHDIIYTGNYETLMAGLYYTNAVQGSTLENMFLLRNATGLRNMTLIGLNGVLGAENAYGTKRPTAGAYASLDPGYGPEDTRVWITERSPYVQGVTNFGTGCVGMKIDGDLHDGGNDSIVSNDFTQVISDGIAAWITNLGRAEMVSVFSYYGHIGYLAENGGKIRGTNGNCSYGDFGAVSEGVDDTEIPITGSINNRKLEAQIGYVLTDGDEILHLEYTNAGINYTEATYTITGNGFGAETDTAQVTDGGVFEVRLRNPDDGSTYDADGEPDSFGGRGFNTNANTAQDGDTTSITLSNTEVAESAEYVGMRIVIQAGKGAGQYGYITSYNANTKVANIAKESDDTAGWDTFHYTNPIETTLDATTTYIVEPRVTFSGGGGTGAFARARVSDERVVEIRIINPGSGYTSAPTMTITDPSSTQDVPHTVRIGDGVLGQPTWTNRGVDFETAQGEVSTGDGYADIYQTGQYINVENLTDIPAEGSNLVITGDSRYFKVVAVRELLGEGPYTANLQIAPDTGIESAPEHGTTFELRIRYSQVRLTGHDFLDIGTGGFASTNYPNAPLVLPDPEDEVNEAGGGRVFYTSTDQDGNFRVGRLFNVEQATGQASLNVNAFSLAGLQELQLGAVGLGAGGAVINEFSTDGTFSANSDNVVPTQRAIIAYINSQIGGGQSELNVNAITAGVVNITGDTISTSTNVPINVTATANFEGGISGDPVALGYFLK
jgi:hypothetical protein